MNTDPQTLIMRAPFMPYTSIVGQRDLKLALEISHLEPRISGVLISGERGTGKSTTVRAFSRMVRGRFPVTLPINATEDRVVGGWKISKLMAGKAEPQPGLLEEADNGLLYVDEVNLLDDHIVNIILDVTSTGILVVEREGVRNSKQVSFSLVGTMNPEEGALRPQLLDRFGLMVSVRGESDLENRRRILERVLALDDPGAVAEGQREDEAARARIEAAREQIDRVELSKQALAASVRLSQAFGADGHRGELMLALAARALAALEDGQAIRREHLERVAPLALQHRRKVSGTREAVPWNPEQDGARVRQELDDAWQELADA